MTDLADALGLYDKPWQAYALCPQVDPELFFPDKGGTGKPAKKICAACPVQPDCREYALTHTGLEGIWGGLSYEERVRIRNDNQEAAA